MRGLYRLKGSKGECKGGWTFDHVHSNEGKADIKAKVLPYTGKDAIIDDTFATL